MTSAKVGENIEKSDEAEDYEEDKHGWPKRLRRKQ